MGCVTSADAENRALDVALADMLEYTPPPEGDDRQSPRGRLRPEPSADELRTRNERIVELLHDRGVTDDIDQFMDDVVASSEHTLASFKRSRESTVRSWLNASATLPSGVSISDVDQTAPNPFAAFSAPLLYDE